MLDITQAKLLGFRGSCLPMPRFPLGLGFIPLNSAGLGHIPLIRFPFCHWEQGYTENAGTEMQNWKCVAKVQRWKNTRHFTVLRFLSLRSKRSSIFRSRIFDPPTRHAENANRSQIVGEMLRRTTSQCWCRLIEQCALNSVTL